MCNQRRDGYWKYYHLAHTRELDFLVDIVVFLIGQNPPAQKIHARGRRKVHSDSKMHCVCILMVVMNLTYRDMQNIIPRLGLPWDEPVPDHTTIARHLGRMSAKWLEGVLAETARMCIGESGREVGMLAADSTGVETLRYEKQSRPDRIRHGFAGKRVRRYLKWHVVAALDHGTILVSRITPGSRNDSPVLRTMLGRMKHLGISCGGSVFCADRGYDSDRTCRMIFGMGMIPNIKQRRPPSGRSSPHRRRAAALFDESAYGYRGLIEGIFGAEETEGHRLLCRFQRRATRYRFGQIRAIGWNLEVLNRMRCSRMLETGVKSMA